MSISPVYCHNECGALIAYNNDSGDTQTVPNITEATITNYEDSYFIGEENFNRTTGKWTCPVSGLYNVSAYISVLASDLTTSGGYLRFAISKNDGLGIDYGSMFNTINYVPSWDGENDTEPATGTYGIRPHISGLIHCERGDTLKMQVYNAIGASATFYVPYLTIAPISHKPIVTSL